jgi:hypothetical protein
MNMVHVCNSTDQIRNKSGSKIQNMRLNINLVSIVSIVFF